MWKLGLRLRYSQKSGIFVAVRVEKEVILGHKGKVVEATQKRPR
jgi:hypothetical protein